MARSNKQPGWSSHWLGTLHLFLVALLSLSLSLPPSLCAAVDMSGAGAEIQRRGMVNQPKWRSVNLLIAIYFGCMSMEFDKSDCVLLERTILKWHELFAAAWGLEFSLPKHHFCLHIPHQMWLLGPCKFWWCMRFEAKHQW